MGDLSLQEPEPREITGSNTDRFPPTLVPVGLSCGAQLKLGSNRTGEFESKPLGDYVNHNGVSCQEVADPIYKSSLGSDSNGG
jgi:hypothetical protein